MAESRAGYAAGMGCMKHLRCTHRRAVAAGVVTDGKHARISELLFQEKCGATM